MIKVTISPFGERALYWANLEQFFMVESGENDLQITFNGGGSVWLDSEQYGIRLT